MEKDFTRVQNAVYEVLMNTPCKNPLDAVMALCGIMCDILVQIKMDNNEFVCDSVIKTLDLTRKAYSEQEIH